MTVCLRGRISELEGKELAYTPLGLWFVRDFVIALSRGPNIIIVDIYSGAVLHKYFLVATKLPMQCLRVPDAA